MNRSSFGFWGLELSPEEFARALAALGVLHRWRWRWWPEPLDVDEAANLLGRHLELERPFAPWQIQFPLFDGRMPRERDRPSATVLAKAWEQVHGFWPRLELVVGEEEPFWLVEELSRDSAQRHQAIAPRKQEESQQQPPRRRKVRALPLLN